MKEAEIKNRWMAYLLNFDWSEYKSNQENNNLEEKEKK